MAAGVLVGISVVGRAEANTSVACDVMALINAVGTAVTSGGTQVLDLASGCTYTLTAVNNTDVSRGPNGLPEIGNNVTLTINGNGSTITRSGPVFRIMMVNTGSTLTLNDLTISNGNPGFYGGNAAFGGGILNDGGTVNLNRCTITNNKSGDGSTGTDGGPGGGIFNSFSLGTINITECTLSQNSGGNGAGSSSFGGNGGDGGAFYNDGIAVIQRSTFAGNRAGNGGNAPSIGGAAGTGGAIWNNATMTIVNSTFDGNQGGTRGTGSLNGNASQAGALFSNGTLSILNSTFHNNSADFFGAVEVVQTVTWKNTVVANSTGGNCFIATTGAGSTNNIADDGTCGSSFTQFTSAQINLGSLQNNGGPTDTVALQSPSTAIGAGDTTTCQSALVGDIDQRGAVRIAGADTTCDVGAFEVDGALPTATPTITPTTTPSETPSVTPSSTPSSTPTNTPSVTATSTPTSTPSVTPSATPTCTPTATPFEDESGPAACADRIDNDHDGMTDCADPDCFDDAPCVHDVPVSSTPSLVLLVLVLSAIGAFAVLRYTR